MIEAAFTLIGVVIGFLLNEIATRIREEQTEKRKVRAVRAIVNSEIEHNLELLQEFWIRVINSTKIILPATRETALAFSLIQLPLPSWDKSALKSQMQQLPMALQEQEILKIFHLYTNLAKLEAIRTSLKEAALVTQTNLGVTQDVISPNAVPFIEKVPGHWQEFENLVAEIQRSGNPLKTKGN